MTTEHKTFVFTADPGHGWLAVTISDLAEVGVPISAISKYSYKKGDTVYLEEDCDAAKFWQAFTAKYGHQPEVTDKYVERTHIRNLPRVGA